MQCELEACCYDEPVSVWVNLQADLNSLVDTRKMAATLRCAKTWLSTDPTASAESHLSPSKMVKLWQRLYPNVESLSAAELQDITLFQSSSDSDMNRIELVMQHFADLNTLLASLGFMTSVLCSYEKKGLLHNNALFQGMKRAVEVSCSQGSAWHPVWSNGAGNTAMRIGMRSPKFARQ